MKEVTIHATKRDVWSALTDPGKVKQYMHGTEMSTDWKEGSPISWRGEWKGKAYEDKGTVLAVEPQKVLQYTHWSPMGGSEDKPENYHTVTYRLDGDDGTTKLTLTQDNNATEEEAEKMANDNWGPVLQGLKDTVENSA
ncbi:MAG TPA: SRPBCC domain-containing protein [Candidatus Dormibacteraeota bacterium]